MSAALPHANLPAVDYPTGDGKPVAETPLHFDILTGLIQVLRHWYADNPRAYVAGNMLMYYQKGKPHRHVSPDVFVTLGIDKTKPRDAYFVWEEGKGPDVVIEVSSKSTWGEDLDTKFELYRDVLGVSEYFLFDPRKEYLTPSLLGYRLKARTYVPIKPVQGRLPSTVLGLHLEEAGEWLRLYDPGTGEWLKTSDEKVEAERQRADSEHQRADGERQRADSERQQAEAERHRADTERQRADAERRRADTERQRADAAEAELARLRARLDQPDAGRGK